MLSFGLMTLSFNHEKTYFYELAKRAHSLNIECYRFIPSSINPSNEKISGDKYNPIKNEWETCEFLTPDVLYDRCFYGEDGHSKQCKTIVKWLKARNDLLFLGYGLPNKLELYDKLSQSKLSSYLLPSKAVISGNSVIQDLSLQKPIVLKPVNGSQGRGIYILERKEKEIIVQTEKHGQHIIRSLKDTKKTASWLNHLIKQRSYFSQPYMKLLNDENHPFDIRTLLQKDKYGNWHEVSKGIRTGRENGIISNISAGGTISPIDSWLSSLPSSKRNYFSNEIEDILINLPNILELNFPPLFEIGVDIGICRDGGIWILDINSKPGRKVALTLNPHLEEKLYSSPLQYANTIFERQRKETPQ